MAQLRVVHNLLLSSWMTVRTIVTDHFVKHWTVAVVVCKINNTICLTINLGTMTV